MYSKVKNEIQKVISEATLIFSQNTIVNCDTHQKQDVRNIHCKILSFLILLLACMDLGAVDNLGTAPIDGFDTALLRILSAYYIPDPKPPENSNQVEGTPKPAQNGLIFAPLQRLYKEHTDFGGVRVVLKNDSTSEVRIDQVRLNGKPIEKHYVDFLDGKWDDRGVVWYRARPRILAPGQCGEIYIRFRRRPEGSRATVSVVQKDGKTLDAIFSYDDPGIRVDYVTTDDHRLYVYARRSMASLGSLQNLTIDGIPVKNAKIYGAGFPGGIALAVVELPTPFRIGDFHIAQVTTSSGQTVAAQFRVLPSFFMRTGWRWFPKSPEEVREVSMNYVENAMPLAEAERLNVYTGAGNHKRMLLKYVYDEPDAKDIHPDFKKKYGDMVKELGPLYTGSGYAVGLGLTAREKICKIVEETELKLPQVATYLITNGTTRPLNWFVYGQITDIASNDPYPANCYGTDWATVREQYILMHEASAPRRIYACLEAYTSVKLDTEGFRRSPSGSEFRQMAVQALGCGVKGINSWFWSKGSGMLGANFLPEIRAEYIRINKTTEHIERELLLGTPADIVSNDAGLTPTGSWYYTEDGPFKLKQPWMKDRVWTGALLCGPDTIIIAAANHIPASKTKPEHIEAARNVNITVELPDFLRKISCFEVDADGLTPYSCRIEQNKAVIKLDTIESGRIFLLRRK